MQVALNFGDHPDVRFEHAPLASVLCQLQFAPILSLLSDAGVAGFQEAVRPEYPSLKPERNARVNFGPNQVGVQQSAPVWRFFSQDEHWRLGLAADFVSLETDAYVTIEDFLGRLSSALEVLERTIRTGDFIRIGLRKINSIERPVERFSDWARYINPSLLGAVGDTTIPDEILFALSDLRFKDDDNTMAVRHGLFPDKADTYLIDIDYFTERPYGASVDSGVTELLHYFSKGMTSFFHWATTDHLKSELAPVPRSGGST